MKLTEIEQNALIELFWDWYNNHCDTISRESDWRSLNYDAQNRAKILGIEFDMPDRKTDMAIERKYRDSI